MKKKKQKMTVVEQLHIIDQILEALPPPDPHPTVIIGTITKPGK
jgi:hypothetical protein